MKTRGKHTIKQTKKTQGAHSLRITSARATPSHFLAWRVMGAVCALALVAATPLAALAAQEQQASSNLAGQSGFAQATSYISPLVGTGPAKNEVVYAKLDASGAAQGVYVVNSFASDAAANVTDPGSYTKVTNLSTTDKLAVGDGAVSFSKQAGTFYYQGDLPATTALPWNISINYSIDGQAIAPADLGGKSGKLGITVRITPNTSVDSVFADNYLLQVSGTFPAATTMNIVAEGATVADSGSDKLVNYMLLPGQSKTYTLSADVTDFEFGGFQISGVPLSMTLDVDSFDTSGMTSEMDTLKNSIAQVADGTSGVYGGAQEIGSALGVFAEKGTVLAGYSTQIADGLAGLAVGMRGDGTVTNPGIVPSSQAIVDGAETGISDAEAQEATASQALTAATTAYGTAYATMQILLAGLQTTVAPTQAQIDELCQAADNMNTKAADLAAATGALYAATGAKTALRGVCGEAATPSTEATKLHAFNDGLQEYANNLYKLSENYRGSEESFDSGVQAYTGGVATLATKYGQFQSGIGTLADGTTQLKDATSNLDQQLLDRVKQEISNYMDYSFSARSFVVSSNTNVKQVQFVFMTDAVSAPKAEVEVPEEQPTSFIDRITGLFS